MLLFVVSLAATGYLMHALNPTTAKIERDKKTALALAEAKAAIIGWSVKNNTPGKLPCPEDLAAIGFPTEGQETAAAGDCPSNIGRLPWRSLGVGDLRDGYGERLWYVLSPGFRVNPINSDTPAQLIVDGVAGNAVAIIFSAGPVINGQVRPTPTNVTPPDVIQYLDISNNDGDNAFINLGSSVNFNDELLVINHDDLFSVVEKRVASEVLNCLEIYAAGNGGKYPWASSLSPVDYIEDATILMGRLPDSPGGGNWSGACAIPVGGVGWWLNWKEQVFFSIAEEYKPTGTATACGSCLTVNPPSASVDKKIVVIVAGKAIIGQNRAANTTLNSYLEAPNNGGIIFSQQHSTPAFNDVVVYH